MLGAVLSSEAGLAVESEDSRCSLVTSADFAVLSGVKVGFLIVASLAHSPEKLVTERTGGSSASWADQSF